MLKMFNFGLALTQSDWAKLSLPCFTVQYPEPCLDKAECYHHFQLGPGECFGTFIAIDGQTMHKSMLMVNTKEPNCEFMKITTSDYNRVIEVSGRIQQNNKAQQGVLMYKVVIPLFSNINQSACSTFDWVLISQSDSECCICTIRNFQYNRR